jgi:hypothetical protein
VSQNSLVEFWFILRDVEYTPKKELLGTCLSIYSSETKVCFLKSLFFTPLMFVRRTLFSSWAEIRLLRLRCRTSRKKWEVNFFCSRHWTRSQCTCFFPFFGGRRRFRGKSTTHAITRSCPRSPPPVGGCGSARVTCIYQRRRRRMQMGLKSSIF